MKAMNAKELRGKTTTELRELLSEREKELFSLRMQHFTGQLDQSSRLRATRREIARIRTLMGEQEG